jgi:GNAT superfamily N-acetyltransferase
MSTTGSSPDKKEAAPDMGITYESTYDPAEDMLKIVADGLAEYNESRIGKHKSVPVASFARDDSGEVIAGIYGTLSWDWLYVDRLWVSEKERGKGIGRHLMLEVERMALEKGVSRSHLCTGSFQALDFYLDLGYTVICQMDDQPRGHTNYLMKKDLQVPVRPGQRT